MFLYFFTILNNTYRIIIQIEITYIKSLLSRIIFEFCSMFVVLMMMRIDKIETEKVSCILKSSKLVLYTTRPFLSFLTRKDSNTVHAVCVLQS